MAAYEASEDLQAALKAAKEAEAVYEATMQRLREAVVREMALPSKPKPSDVGTYVGWHPSHVRKLARAAGVPGWIDRPPPPPRRKLDYEGGPHE